MCFPTSDVVTAAPDYMGERGAVPPVQHWHGMAVLAAELADDWFQGLSQG